MSVVEARSGAVRARPALRLTGLVAGMLALLVLWAAPASAHVDLLESTPANVSTVAGPVRTVTFRFSGAADPVTDKFAIEDASGGRVPIASVANDGSSTIVVTAAGDLAAGRSKVTWALRGADGHTMTGTIAFTVTGTSAPTTIAGGAATPPSSTASSGTASSAAASVGGGDTTGLADRVATFFRWIVYGAILFCVGGLVYLVTVHRGTRAESRRLVFYVRRATVVVVLASLGEWFAQLVVYDLGTSSALVSPSVWWDLGTSGFGIGTLLRLVGAALVLGFLALETDDADRFDDVDLTWIAGDAEARRSPGAVRTVDAPLARVRVEASPLAFVGAILLVLSESFIGHTAAVPPRIVMAVSDAVHMVAGGAWAAGAFLLAATLWRRHRRGESTDARILATRFSVLAAGSLAAVGVSGLVMAWVILDGFGPLVSSEFGRLLLVKVLLVAVVAAIGAYNHRVMVPALAAGDETVGGRFRAIVTGEAVLFAAVLLVTALLVVANPLG